MTNFHKIQTLKKWWQQAVVAIGVMLLKLYWSTLRIRLSDAAKQTLCSLEKRAIFAFWHSNLFVAYALKKTLGKKNVYGLVSPSRDGAWLTEIFHTLGIDIIRGSSSRNGLSAISSMTEKLLGGAFVAITPDGPRGPKHKFKIGTAMIAKQAKADVVIVATKYNHFFTLSTWDRFKVPLPFSGICVNSKTFYHKDFEHLSTMELSKTFEKGLNDLQTITDEQR
ncbi:MAG: DUF374 domain-containing protein [Puniceicoccales bacterium]|jgi:lysophospholipid acyltransferase (LPLAT)-like uncharacterized protein|nr:DUF374 domain-containing protein [Puniceicoccales bacterium]